MMVYPKIGVGKIKAHPRKHWPDETEDDLRSLD